MKSSRVFSFIALVFICTFIPLQSIMAQPGGESDIWVSAYYAGWSQGWFNNGVVPADAIDYSAVTHIIHFALWPRADGTFDSDANSIRESNSAALISRAHAAGKKVLICIGGWGSQPAFRGATSPFTVSRFVDNLVNFMTSRGYDGIDIDWEILELADVPQYTLFIRELRARLNQVTPRPLLAAAVVWQPAVFAALSNEFDQINIMTYDISGAWPGWVVWHNAATTTNGLRFQSNGRLIPSAETMADEFINAGVPAKKIGIGIDFYGYIWSGGSGTPTGGVTAPGQSWSSAPRIQINVPYYSIMQNHYQPQHYRWDSVAQVPYLSIDNPGSGNDRFVSYDNEWSNVRKVEYARAKGLGGVFIWELGGGYLPEQFPNRGRLLQSIKMAVQRDTVVPQLTSVSFPLHNTVGIGLNPKLTWQPSPDATFYRLQVATDSAFSSVVIDQDAILWNEYSLNGLTAGVPYYWRVLPTNVSASGEWSSLANFTTMANTLLPGSWAHIAFTGNSATVRIPGSVIPLIGARSLRSGDAVGVFFKSGSAAQCAGYGVWQENQDLVFTVWGDNSETTAKDGLMPDDTLWFQIWDIQRQREYAITQAAFASGTNSFRSDSTYTLSSLVALPYVQHTIMLAKGENMISSYVRPADSVLVSLLAGIRPRMLALRNGLGQVFMPDSNINTIGTWNAQHGYSLYMKSADMLTLIGEEVAPEQTSLKLSQGWNLIPYLRNSPMQVDSAFTGGSDKLLILKNLAGQVYWPEKGFNQLGMLRPGQSYQLYAKESTTLTYPENTYPAFRTFTSGSSFSPTLTPTLKRGEIVHEPNSGANAILLIEASGLQDWDEIRVGTAEMHIGEGTVNQGKALIIVWGDNKLTAAVEGAKEGEPLSLTVWSGARRREEPLILSLVSDELNGETSSVIRYATDAVWVARVKSIPEVFTLEQNFPNPFNPTTTIRYTLPQQSSVTLEVFDVLGRKVATVIDRLEQQAGYYDTPFRSPGLTSGLYFYRLRADALVDAQNSSVTSRTTFSQTKKMVILK